MELSICSLHDGHETAGAFMCLTSFYHRLWGPSVFETSSEDINQILELPLHAGNIPGQEELTQDSLPLGMALKEGPANWVLTCGRREFCEECAESPQNKFFPYLLVGAIK